MSFSFYLNLKGPNGKICVLTRKLVKKTRKNSNYYYKGEGSKKIILNVTYFIDNASKIKFFFNFKSVYPLILNF